MVPPPIAKDAFGPAKDGIKISSVLACCRKLCVTPNTIEPQLSGPL